MNHELIAIIDVGKIWYSGSDDILVEMAHRAREMGADAVINVKRWHQPSGFSWAAPHGQGQAVEDSRQGQSSRCIGARKIALSQMPNTSIRPPLSRGQTDASTGAGWPSE